VEGVGVVIIALFVLVAIGVGLSRQRKRAASIDLEDTSWLRTTVSSAATAETERKAAPVKDFHVHGEEARVTFDVPLDDEDDPILDELLVDEAVEVVREKRHTLPITDVTEIVVFAGRGAVREVGRTRLPAPGMLPPPLEIDLLNLTHVARDPFNAQFEPDHVFKMVETAPTVPSDDLGPIQAELRIPRGLDRGLRARGVDPAAASTSELLLALLEMFGYKLVPQGEPNVFIASKDNLHTFIKTLTHRPGEHPELDESDVQKFIVETGTSGAQRGILVTDKYGPFMLHDIETRNPRMRYLTRERIQPFIDSMALG
jgi:hypothetical protein